MERHNIFVNGYTLPVFEENGEIIHTKAMFINGCKLNNDSKGIPVTVYTMPWIEYCEQLVVGAVRNGLQPEKRVGYPICPKQYRAEGITENQLIAEAKKVIGEADFFETYRIESVVL